MKQKALQFNSAVTKKIGVLLLIFAAILCIPTISLAQDTGYISGTVTDKSGAAVAGAEVVVALVGGNLTRTTETNTDGTYVAAALPAGTYNVTVTAKGFQRFQAKDVVLVVAQKARVDAQLTVGTALQSIQVTAEVPLVETGASDFSTTVDTRTIQDMPLQGRDIQTLVQLIPGVIQSSGPSGATFGFNSQFGGFRPAPPRRLQHQRQWGTGGC